MGHRKQSEEALARYAYDITETRERLDKEGRARHKEIRAYEVYYVRGRPVRRLVARDGRELTGRDREKEDRKAWELAQAIRDGRAVSESPGVRLSRILERYDFQSLGGERHDERCTLVFSFAAKGEDSELEKDPVLRKLTGRLWVDEEERAVTRLQVLNTDGIRFALGVGASVSTLSFEMAFARMEDGVWLPRRLEAYAEGRRWLFRRFRSRRTTVYSHYRRFQVGVDEEIRESPERR